MEAIFFQSSTLAHNEFETVSIYLSIAHSWTQVLKPEIFIDDLKYISNFSEIFKHALFGYYTVL